MDAYQSRNVRALLSRRSIHETEAKQFAPWKLLGPNMISNVLLLTVPSSGSANSDLSCNSFLSSYSDWDGDRHIYLHPLVCPSAPIRLLSITSTTPATNSPRFVQLNPRQSLIAVYFESSDYEQTQRDNFLRSGIITSLVSPDPATERIDTLVVFDVQKSRPISQYFLRVPIGRSYCTCIQDEDGTIRIFYFDHSTKLGASVVSSVYSTRLDLVDEDGFLSLQLVDSNTSSVSDGRKSRFCVSLFKRIDYDYFVWFLEEMESAFDSDLPIFPHKGGIVCVSYHRSADGTWVWSPKPVPFLDWIKSDQGSILWSAAQGLNTIQYQMNPISLLRNVEAMPMAKMITAMTSHGILRLNMGVPSLSSMTADLINEMVEDNVKKTGFLGDWKGWVRLIGATGLFKPCQPGYDKIYLSA